MGKSSLEIAKTIKLTAGYRGFYAGLLPTALRDGIFSVGFLVEQPWIKEQLINAGFDQNLASVMGGGLAGVLAVVLTQPFDTIKTWRQSDPSIMKNKNYLDLAKENNTKGLSTLYLGLIPRAIRGALAIIVLSSTKDYLKNL